MAFSPVSDTASAPCGAQAPSGASAQDAPSSGPLFRRAPFVVRGFSHTTDVLEAARLCREAGVACRLVPRPASLGNAECGTALRTLPEDEPQVLGLLFGAGIEPDGTVETVDYV